jgi:hypothetical protein
MEKPQEAISLTIEETNQVLKYLQTRPWGEVNSIMVMLINKMNKPKK